MTESATKHRGGCLCGAVRYEVLGPLRSIVACHCSQCRRTSGHYVAMTSAPSLNVHLTSASSLTWYKSSDTAERGFCRICGGNLFWRQFRGTTMSITAGTLDAPTHLSVEKHIFVEDKSDYYEINDHIPQSAQWA
jgi:hypothetical protein